MFLGLLSAFHLHSDYGWLRSSPRALIWSEGGGLMVTSKDVGVGCHTEFWCPSQPGCSQGWADLFVHL